MRNLPDELGAEDVFHAFSEYGEVLQVGYGEVLQVGARSDGGTVPSGRGRDPGVQGAGCSVWLLNNEHASKRASCCPPPSSLPQVHMGYEQGTGGGSYSIIQVGPRR